MLFQTDYTIYTLPIFDRVRVAVGIRFNVQKSIVIPLFLKIRCRRVDQPVSYPVRDLTDRELVCLYCYSLLAMSTVSVTEYTNIVVIK